MRRLPPRRAVIPVVLTMLAATTLIPTASASGSGSGKSNKHGRDFYVRSTTENVVFGGFPIDQPPVLTIRSGSTVKIDTMSQRGATSPESPVEYFGQFGVKERDVLPDVVAFWESIPNRPRYGGHIMTGPIYVEGAQPGDTLKIEVLDIDTRVPYGINGTTATSGVMGTGYPGWREGDQPLAITPEEALNFYRTGKYRGEEVAFFNDKLRVPLHSFMGVMAVAPRDGEFVGSTPDAPPPATGVQGSGPPGPYGGNMDVRDLTVGSTLYLPVFQEGGQVFMGDPHSVQGDGEVSGSAIEQSLSGRFRITLHKGKTIDGPWAEDKDHWIMMGIDWDLDRAMRFAVENTVDFLVREKGFTVAKAFSFASIAVNYRTGEVVDGTQVVTGMIPKSLFERARR